MNSMNSSQHPLAMLGNSSALIFKIREFYLSTINKIKLFKLLFPLYTSNCHSREQFISQACLVLKMYCLLLFVMIAQSVTFIQSKDLEQGLCFFQHLLNQMIMSPLIDFLWFLEDRYWWTLVSVSISLF